MKYSELKRSVLAHKGAFIERRKKYDGSEASKSTSVLDDPEVARANKKQQSIYAELKAECNRLIQLQEQLNAEVLAELQRDPKFVFSEDFLNTERAQAIIKDLKQQERFSDLDMPEGVPVVGLLGDLNPLVLNVGRSSEEFLYQQLLNASKEGTEEELRLLLNLASLSTVSLGAAKSDERQGQELIIKASGRLQMLANWRNSLESSPGAANDNKTEPFLFGREQILRRLETDFDRNSDEIKACLDDRIKRVETLLKNKKTKAEGMQELENYLTDINKLLELKNAIYLKTESKEQQGFGQEFFQTLSDYQEKLQNLKAPANKPKQRNPSAVENFVKFWSSLYTKTRSSTIQELFDANKSLSDKSDGIQEITKELNHIIYNIPTRSASQWNIPRLRVMQTLARLEEGIMSLDSYHTIDDQKLINAMIDNLVNSEQLLLRKLNATDKLNHYKELIHKAFDSSEPQGRYLLEKRLENLVSDFEATINKDKSIEERSVEHHAYLQQVFTLVNEHSDNLSDEFKNGLFERIAKLESTVLSKVADPVFRQQALDEWQSQLQSRVDHSMHSDFKSAMSAVQWSVAQLVSSGAYRGDIVSSSDLHERERAFAIEMRPLKKLLAGVETDKLSFEEKTEYYLLIGRMGEGGYGREYSNISDNDINALLKILAQHKEEIDGLIENIPIDKESMSVTEKASAAKTRHANYLLISYKLAQLNNMLSTISSDNFTDKQEKVLNTIKQKVDDQRTELIAKMEEPLKSQLAIEHFREGLDLSEFAIRFPTAMQEFPNNPMVTQNDLLHLTKFNSDEIDSAGINALMKMLSAADENDSTQQFKNQRLWHLLLEGDGSEQQRQAGEALFKQLLQYCKEQSVKDYNLLNDGLELYKADQVKKLLESAESHAKTDPLKAVAQLKQVLASPNPEYREAALTLISEQPELVQIFYGESLSSENPPRAPSVNPQLEELNAQAKHQTPWANRQRNRDLIETGKTGYLRGHQNPDTVVTSSANDSAPDHAEPPEKSALEEVSRTPTSTGPRH